MAIYHLHVDIVKRSSGRSSIASSAYRSADKLRSDSDGMTHDYTPKSSSVNTVAYQAGESLSNEKEDIIHDYTRKRGVVHTEIMLPYNAPREFEDRATLWNAVEKSEKRKDAQTARDMDVALPIELDRQEHIELVRGFVKENFVDKGMCADFAIHDKGDGNPHVHILLTMRDVTREGFGNKNRDWNKKAQLKKWRESWAKSCNKRLQDKGHPERIDHRTLKAQGIDREPTKHIGVAGKYMEKRGQTHDRSKQNKEIIRQNKIKRQQEIAERMYKFREGYISLDREASSLRAEATEANREMNSLRKKAEEIAGRTDDIQAMKKQLDELRTERHDNQQLQQLERSHEQATAYFQRTYQFDPTQAGEEVKRLAIASESKKHLQAKLEDKILSLNEEKVEVCLKYQRQKLLVDSSPDRQKINYHLAELEKERRQHIQLGVQDNLARVRCQDTLDTISQQDFYEILKTVPPEKVQALIEQRELERVREHVKTFQRGR